VNQVAETRVQTQEHVLLQKQPTSDFERLLMADFQPRDMLMNGELFDRMWRVADLMASGRTSIPNHLKDNVADCMAIVTQAMAWNMNPFLVAQKTHLVNGTLGYEAQLVMAVINGSPLLARRLDFEWHGNWIGVNGKDDRSAERFVRAFATLRGESTPREIIVSMAQVGTVRNSPLWGADPRQQLAYLAAKRWARLYASDVVLGVYTPDELAEGAAQGIGEYVAAPPPPAPAGPQRRSAKKDEAAPAAATTQAPAPAATTTAAAPASSPAAAPAASADGTQASLLGGSAEATGEVIAPGEALYLRNKMKQAGVEEPAILERFKKASLEVFTKGDFDTLKSELLAML
jgi:hypothetical protein